MSTLASSVRAAVRAAFSGSSLMAMVCAAGLLAGCQGGGSAAGGAGSGGSGTPSAQTSFDVNYQAWSNFGYRLDWVGFPFPAAVAPRVTEVKAYDDVVVAQQADTTVAVLEASTGRYRWATDLANPLTKFVGIVRDANDPSRIIVSSESEAFILSLPNGNLLARERFQKVVNTPPVQVGNLGVYGTSVGEVLAHLYGRGVKAWGFDTIGAIEADIVTVGDTLCAVSQAGDVMFLGGDGTLRGRARIYGPLANNPVANENAVFIAGTDQSVWAFDAQGRSLWRYRTAERLTAQPALHEGVLYVHIPGDGMKAFDAVSGSVKWTQKDAAGEVIGLRGSNLVVRTDRGLALLNPSDGGVENTMDLPGVTRVVTDQFVDGRLYEVNTNGLIAKFAPQ